MTCRTPSACSRRGGGRAHPSPPPGLVHQPGDAEQRIDDLRVMFVGKIPDDLRRGVHHLQDVRRQCGHDLYGRVAESTL